MNVDHMIRMVFRMFVRKAVNRGMNAGIDRVAGGGKTPQTPEDKARARQAKKMGRRANQAQRIARRMGRF